MTPAATAKVQYRIGGMAAERGILMRAGEAFQVLKDVRKLVFDKTGTLTAGKPAATGLVHPVWAMIAMAASVTAVLTNSFAGRLLPRRSVRQRAALEVAVGNMHCEHCVDTIRKGLLEVEGVEAVSGDPVQKRVSVAYRSEAIGPEGIRRAIRAHGYDAA